VFVAPALNQDIKHIPILIHRSPEIVFLATDCEKDLVQVPLVPTPRAAPAEFVCVRLAKRASTTDVRFHRSRQSRAVRRPLFDITRN
jgi:hypothetical protein